MDIDLIDGDWRGTTFKDWIIEPSYTPKDCSPDRVDITTDIFGMKMYPFMVAAMRSLVNEEMALEAAKNRIMAVVPRGLPIDRQKKIVEYVKGNKVKPGNIEKRENPVYLLHNQRLGDALEITSEYGHSNIPVKNEKTSELMGIFAYRPSKHNNMDETTPITKVLTPLKRRDKTIIPTCRYNMGDEKIKKYMKKHNLRMVPVVDNVGRLNSLVFMQQDEAYWIGAAIDTHPGWEKRAEALVEAETDMLFIDTSDANSAFVVDVLRGYKPMAGAVNDFRARYQHEFRKVRKATERYKKLFDGGPPICGGNIVTAEGVRILIDSGADALKEGMGPGSICTTNMVLAIGSSPMNSAIATTMERDKYFLRSRGDYKPLFADGGFTDTYDINLGMKFADAVMLGKMFACFEESAGRKIKDKDGKRHTVYFGEGSRMASMETGNMDRYFLGEKTSTHRLYQGVPGLVEVTGRLKPGLEMYKEALATAMSHVGAHNLQEYQYRGKLQRLSEGAKLTAKPHGIKELEENK